MLLGLSSLDENAELVGELEVDAVGSSANGDGGVAAGAVLTRFAEAVHAGDDSLAAARAATVDAVGEDGLVDAAAVCANFNMMVRIADGTGTPLDPGTADSSNELRAELGLDELTSRRVAVAPGEPTALRLPTS